MLEGDERGQRPEALHALRFALLQAFHNLKQAHCLTKRCMGDVANFIMWIQRLTLSRLGAAAASEKARFERGLPALALRATRLRTHARQLCDKVSRLCSTAFIRL
jgi:hypothetical protein